MLTLLYMTKIKNLIMWPVLLIPVLLLTGCATSLHRSMRAGDSGPAGNCIDFFTSLDHRVAEAGVMDSGDFRIKGYPYLRVNRFLASFQQEIMDKETFAAWINHMQILDQDAREYEMENLPTATGQPSENNKDAFKADVVTCGNLLKTADFKGAGLQMEALRKQVDAPDEYSLLRRIFGLYLLEQVGQPPRFCRFFVDLLWRTVAGDHVKEINHHPHVGIHQNRVDRLHAIR